MCIPSAQVAELVDAQGLGSCRFICGGSSPLLGIIGGFMSLISQKDRENVIESIDFYLISKGKDFSEEKRAELNALLNWVRLEYFKHEN